MCGIVGYVGQEQAAPILLDGLEHLEYRGYDSAGIAVLSEKKGLQVKKSKGRLKVLNALVDGGRTVDGILGIGHTRWATTSVSVSERKVMPWEIRNSLIST